jgi:hypothetical protein
MDAYLGSKRWWQGKGRVDRRRGVWCGGTKLRSSYLAGFCVIMCEEPHVK